MNRTTSPAPRDQPTPFDRARYLLAAHQPRQLPPDGGFEVAFAGRSNAGKSSALNALCRQGALARVSKTPGRTQQLVYFELPQFEQRYLVDLPGYGYAKVPQELQAHWQPLVRPRLRMGEPLRRLAGPVHFLHPLEDDGRQILRYAMERGIPAHALLTKADKLSRGAALNTVQAVRMELARAFGEGIGVQAFSAEAKTGVEELRALIARWLGI
jgi:GTP-binding protein